MASSHTQPPSDPMDEVASQRTMVMDTTGEDPSTLQNKLPQSAIQEGTQTQSVPTASLPRLMTIGQHGVETRTINADELLVTVGSSRDGDVDVYLHDPEIASKQLVVMRIGSEWLFLDSGLKDLVAFDGIQRKQFYLDLSRRCLIRVGSHYMVFAGFQGSAVSTDTVRLKKQRMPDSFSQAPPVARMVVQGDGKLAESSKEPILIGSHPLCDLQVEGPGIQPFHVAIVWNEQDAVIEPLVPSNAQVDRKPLVDPMSINGPAVLQIGNTSFSIKINGNKVQHCQALADENAPFRYFAFTALADSAGNSFTIPTMGYPLILGRSSSADITIRDAAISREHVKLVPSGKSLSCIDLGSANGTFVNCEKIDRIRVRAGDIVQIGNSFFLVHYA